jgi:hypothetical protein
MYIFDIGPWGDKLKKLGLDKHKITLQYKNKHDGRDKIKQQ